MSDCDSVSSRTRSKSRLKGQQPTPAGNNKESEFWTTPNKNSSFSYLVMTPFSLKKKISKTLKRQPKRTQVSKFNKIHFIEIQQDEVLLKIFKFVDPSDRIACLLVNKLWSSSMSKLLWTSIKFTSLSKMYWIWKLLCPQQELIQPSQRYGPLVTKIAYSYTEPSDSRPPPKLPILAFFSHSLFPNLKELHLAGSPAWLDYQFLMNVASSIGSSVELLSLSGVTKLITHEQFKKAGVIPITTR